METQKNKLTNALGLKILLSFIVFTMTFSMVSAFEFDNIVTSNPALKLDKSIDDGAKDYPAIEIKNMFGLGSTLLEGVLEKHTASCGQDCMSEFELVTYTDSSLIDDVKFYTIDEKGNRKEQSIRNYQFYIRDKIIEEEVIDYEWVCTPTGKISLNGTKEETCENKQVGTHIEYTPSYIPYNVGDVMPKGTYVIKLEGQKKPERTVDWIIKTRGKEITDWAVWGNSDVNLRLGLNAFFTMNETGLFVVDSVSGEYNTSAAGANVTGKIDNARAFIGVHGVDIAGSSAVLQQGNFTWNLWVNDGVNSEFIGSSDKVVFGTFTGVISFWSNGGSCTGWCKSSTALPSGWQMVTLTYNTNGTGKMYLNGTAIHTFSETTGWDKTNPVHIGNGAVLAYGLDGADELGFWNRTLSGDEIVYLYNSNVGRTYSGLAGESFITLNFPENNTITSNPTVTFNATASVSGGATLTNMSLFDNSTGTWKLNKTGWIFVNDVSGNNNKGTSVNGVIINSTYAKFGNGGANFDGVNDYVNISNLNQNISSQQDFTIGLWLFINQTTNAQNIISFRTASLRGIGLLEGNYGAGIVSFYMRDASGSSSTVQSPSILNSWSFFTAVYKNSTNNMSLYLNGNLLGSTLGRSILPTRLDYQIGGNQVIGGTAKIFNGSIDEVRIFNRTLSQAEITSLYTSNTIADTTGLVAYYDMDNILNNGVGGTTATATLENTYGNDGSYLWGIEACDSDGDCGYSENRTLTIDTTAPSITIQYPTGTIPYAFLGQNTSLNYTITGADYCWLDYNGTNATIPCLTRSSFILDTPLTLKIWANDSVGNTAMNSSNWNILGFVTSINYSAVTYETKSENFYMNLTYNSSLGALNVKLNYNGTNYSSINYGSGDNGQYKVTLDVPLVSASTNITLYWIINQNSTFGNNLQLVNPINLQLCNTTFNVSALNFSYYDETTLNMIATGINTSIEATFNYWLGSGAIYKNYSFQNLVSTNRSYSFCIDPSNDVNSVIKADLNLDYSATDYLDRTYNFINTPLNNVTQNITLYLLPTTLGTKFFYTVREGVDSVPNVLVSVQKYMVGLGYYKEISVRKADINGQFAEWLEQDKEYRYIISRANVTLASIDRQSICSVAPCEMTLQISTSSFLPQSEIDAYFAQYVNFTLYYNKTTKTVHLNFKDDLGTAHYWRLYVYKPYFKNSTQDVICNITSYSVQGSMSCNTSEYLGDIFAYVYISRSPEKVVDFLTWVNEDVTDTLGLSGLFASVIILIVIIFAGSRNPTNALIMLPFGLVITKLIGFLPLGWGTITAIVVGITIIAMKMRT